MGTIGLTGIGVSMRTSVILHFIREQKATERYRPLCPTNIQRRKPKKKEETETIQEMMVRWKKAKKINRCRKTNKNQCQRSRCYLPPLLRSATTVNIITRIIRLTSDSFSHSPSPLLEASERSKGTEDGGGRETETQEEDAVEGDKKRRDKEVEG